MKTCSRSLKNECSNPFNPQPLENFGLDKKRKDKLTVHCKACLRAHRERTKDLRRETIKNWRLRNPEKMKQYRQNQAEAAIERTRKWRAKYSLLRRYGITNEDWQMMFEKQNGLCAICKKHHNDLTRGLCVDHCHNTLKVRGLLCHPCNQALGLFGDNVEFLQRALNYLKED